MYAGKDPLTGEERYERDTAKTYQAAEIVLTPLQARVDEDRQPKSDPTVRQAIDQWLEVARLEDTTRDHERAWARHQTISDPDHLAAGKLLRNERVGALRPISA